MTFLKGWRTIGFNALSLALMVSTLPEFAAVLPAGWLPFLALGNVLGNMVLRYMTTTPIGRKS